MGGGVSGAGIDEFSGELRLLPCDELPLVVGGGNSGKDWYGEILGRRAVTLGRSSTRGSMSRIANWILSMSGRTAGSTSQQDCMSSHIFGMRPTAAVPGFSGGLPWLNRTGTYISEYELYGSAFVKTSRQRRPKDHTSALKVGEVTLAHVILSGASQRARDASEVG